MMRYLQKGLFRLCLTAAAFSVVTSCRSTTPKLTETVQADSLSVRTDTSYQEAGAASTVRSNERTATAQSVTNATDKSIRLPIGKYQSVEARFGLEFLPENQAILKGNGVDSEVMSYELIGDNGIKFTGGILDSQSVGFGWREDLLLLALKGESLTLEKVERFTIQNFLSQADKALQSGSRRYVAILGRAQQAFYLDDGQFTDQVNELGLNLETLNKVTSSHVNTIQVVGDAAQAVIIVSQPKKKGLDSAVALVSINPNSQFPDNVQCSGNLGTTGVEIFALAKDQILNSGNFTVSCPEGMTQF